MVTVEPYKNFDEALKLVNQSSFGLQAGLFTRKGIDRIARRIDEGSIAGRAVFRFGSPDFMIGKR